MKGILFVVLFCLSFVSHAQKTILKIGTNGWVTVNGQNYKRGYLGSNYTTLHGDSLLAIQYQYGYPVTLIWAAVDTMYLNGDNSNLPFTSMSALITWMDTHFEPLVDTIDAPPTIGDDISGGIPGYHLIVDGSGHLGQINPFFSIDFQGDTVINYAGDPITGSSIVVVSSDSNVMTINSGSIISQNVDSTSINDPNIVSINAPRVNING